MMKCLGNKYFLKHEAVEFEKLPLMLSFMKEAETFLKISTLVQFCEVPENTNKFSSHTL